MRPQNQFDECADLIVFEDEECRTHLESGNDGELARRIGQILRQHFAHGYDKCARSSDPLDGLDPQ